MNSSTEQEKYLKAKADLLQAEKSFYELPQELRNRLIIELFGYEALMEIAKFAERRK